MKNPNYSVLVERYTYGQYRIKLTDLRKISFVAPPGHGEIVREMCTYFAWRAEQVKAALELADDPVAYCESLVRPWNCEYPGGLIRLDNTEKFAEQTRTAEEEDKWRNETRDQHLPGNHVQQGK